jgi:hypothetical protein
LVSRPIAACARITEHLQSDPEEAVASTEVERFDGVDVAEVPSAAWGWSKINVRTWHAVGAFVCLFLLAMLRGNHVGHVEDVFLIAFAVLVLFVLVRDIWGRRRGWLR